MAIISAILEPDPDGSLHLPLPPELRGGKVWIEAKLESVARKPTPAKAGLWQNLPGEFRMAADFDEPLEDFREYME